LFYVSLGLTISYIIRLWLTIFSSTFSRAGPSQTLYCTLLIKAPIFILLATILIQSAFFEHCQPLFLCSLLSVDKLVLFLVLVVGLLLGFVISAYAPSLQSPLDSLNKLASLPNTGLGVSSSLIVLDTKCITAFGTGAAASVVASIFTSSLLTSKLLALLCIFFMLT